VFRGTKSASSSLFESSAAPAAAAITGSSSIPRALNALNASDSDEEDLESTPVVSAADRSGDAVDSAAVVGHAPTAPADLGKAKKKEDGKKVLWKHQ
jgi:hypothetical protein